MIVLEWWMVIILFAAFGACAIYSTSTGIRYGASTMLDILIKKKIVELDRNNHVVPYTRKKNDIV